MDNRMTTILMTPGSHQHDDDPTAVQGWFDVSSWTSRTTIRTRPDFPDTADAPVAAEPASIASVVATAHAVTQAAATAPPGWYSCPGDPDGTLRGYDGIRWTERVTATRLTATAPLTPAVPAETAPDTCVASPAAAPPPDPMSNVVTAGKTSTDVGPRSASPTCSTFRSDGVRALSSWSPC